MNNNLKALIFDLDGVIYRGNTLLAGAKELIRKLNIKQIPYLFLTNNSSKTVSENVKKLLDLGLEINEEQLLNSSHATALWLAEHEPKDSNIFVFGMPGLKQEIQNQEFKLTDKKSDAINADIVVAGINFDINYEDCKLATLAIRNGAKFIATNTDLTLPVENAFWPGGGSMIALLVASSEKDPDVVIGKPSSYIFEIALSKLEELYSKKLAKKNVFMVGDRVETDIIGAKNFGLSTIGILTGVSQKHEFEAGGADFVVGSLFEIAKNEILN